MKPHKTQRILVIDDEMTIRRLLSSFLGSEFDVTTSESGTEAIRIGALEETDLLILDNSMPEITGLEVLEHIRKHSETSKLPVIMLSSNAKSQDRILALEAGADDYLVKPFNPEELRARIRAIMRRVA